MRANRTLSNLALGLSLISLTLACGKGSSSKPTPVELPPIQAALLSTSQEERIPADILATILFKESGISGAKSSALYSNGSKVLGPKLAETAMGLPRETLGLDNSSESDSIAVQMKAYGAWVRKNLDTANLVLPETINKPDDAYDWAWNIARMHFPDARAPKNLQIVFTLELLKAINKGFIWQDPNSDERLELPAKNPPIDLASLSPTVQINLQYDSRESDILAADYLQLTYYNESNALNRARRIEIVHCPYSISVCLGNLLDTSSPSPLGAHYVIPSDYSVLRRPIKVLPHSTPVRRLNENGEIQTINDAIVIMLVGNSGRYVNGVRTQVNPSWYTKEQLSDLGKILMGLCIALPRENGLVTSEQCSTIGSGIVFQDANRHKNFQLGDIPDYDDSIFQSIVKNPSITGAVSATLPNNKRSFTAGTAIPIDFTFIKGTARLEVQRLERCASGKTVWVLINTQFLRSVDRKVIDVTLYDDGPNRNGQQFIRAMAYGSDGSFMNWSNTDFFLTGFEPSEAFSNSSECQI